jgi:hypothetical protein
MQEVARLEAQLEEADLKPKSKASQRPKDTVKREMSAGNSNPHGVKMKRVEMKQLNDVVPILKLKLQEQELTSQAIKGLLFSPYKEGMEISIADLKVKFESLGVKAPKSLLIARYLVEPQKGGEVIFSEQTLST